MNKARRKQIEKLTDRLRDLSMEFESVKDDEEFVRDSIPENLQGSERYEQSDEACDILEEVVSSIDELISQLEDIY